MKGRLSGFALLVWAWEILHSMRVNLYNVIAFSGVVGDCCVPVSRKLPVHFFIFGETYKGMNLEIPVLL